MDASVSATSRTILSILGDSSVLAGGPNPDTSVYIVNAPTALTGITGIRIELLEDGSLPDNSPGRAINGNFVLYLSRFRSA